jgi:hypothetical protein
MTVVPYPPYVSLFPQLKIKLKGRHFDTTEVIEAESYAVLNILTEHDFQDAYGRSSGNGAYARKGTISRVMVASRPQLVLYGMAAPFPEILVAYLNTTDTEGLFK